MPIRTMPLRMPYQSAYPLPNECVQETPKTKQTPRTQPSRKTTERIEGKKHETQQNSPSSLVLSSTTLPMNTRTPVTPELHWMLDPKAHHTNQMTVQEATSYHPSNAVPFQSASLRQRPSVLPPIIIPAVVHFPEIKDLAIGLYFRAKS